MLANSGYGLIRLKLDPLLGFAFKPRDIAFVLLTHAHIDHSGLLPRLVAEGFSGPIYATAATCDLLEVMLLDSAHIQEKEAQWRNEARKASSCVAVRINATGAEDNTDF